ncbi:MAG: PmoA family protein [Pirellulales bacterium]|nr:PmoA family protein [Pirellulales bacterium]
MRRIIPLTILGFASAVFGIAVSAADASAPVLVVPSSPSTVDLTVPLPDAVQPDPSASWRLVQVGNPEISVPVQLSASVAADGSPAKQTRVIARIPPAQSSRKFELLPSGPSAQRAQSRFVFKDNSGTSLGLLEDGKPVLVYNHGTMTCKKVPQEDSRRSRACYVHPVWGLDGEVLTDDFPKDHYHHHGIFWAWPHVGIDGGQYDLWIYNNIQHRFVAWLCRQTGPLAAVLAVENGWFVGDKKVMIERVWMRSHAADGDRRALDFEFTWIPIDRPITLWGADGKSYGGLNLRFAPREDTRITVPAGLTKADLPDTPLEWADLSARFAGASGPSGAAIFVDPGHPDYPPTWLTRHYGVLCVGWPGVKPRTFEPGKPIQLNYRIWLHRGAAELALLQGAYAAYQAAMTAKWE